MNARISLDDKLSKNKRKDLHEQIKREVEKEFEKQIEQYEETCAVQVLNVLRFEFGFGQKRLERFADCLTKMQNEYVDRYEIPQRDIPWVARKKLEESGIDVKRILD